MKTNLYLIALVPGNELREQVRQLKLEMSEFFNASHALKAPAHITLQMPFRREEFLETEIQEELENFTSTRVPFLVTLDGFDSFPPRVLFLNVVNHEPIKKLHAELKEHLKNALYFTRKELNEDIHPHMTIATRDLSKKMFRKAWPEFRERPFKASFMADQLYLLKHNGKEWEFFREFLFKDDEQ